MNSTRFSQDSIEGATPPSIFVGRHGYPKVKLGPMVPPMHGDTTILDKPEMWSGKSIEEIVCYRLSLVRGVMIYDIHTPAGRYIESLQELAMANKPAESEALFEKKPVPDLEQVKKKGFDIESVPFGLVGDLKSFRTSCSIRADERLENAYYDTDLEAKSAIVSLYGKGVDLSTIQRIFSLGMLGSAKKRRLVPTRWSISATDDIVSSYLVKNTETNNVVDCFEVYKYSHLGNYYSIILIPDQLWSFEMQEAWFDTQGNPGFAVDFEDANGLQQYPSSVAGAYFAARLAVAEHLSKRKRKAAALVLREIHSDEYVVPVGVWQIREGIRQAFDNLVLKKEFDNLGHASKYACSSLSVSETEWVKNSKLYRNYRRSQLRISQFFPDML
ncbi:MAG TPA: hypothetical protein VGK47_06200 [Nitrososphaeraceae archaeon]